MNLKYRKFQLFFTFTLFSVTLSESFVEFNHGASKNAYKIRQIQKSKNQAASKSFILPCFSRIPNRFPFYTLKCTFYTGVTHRWCTILTFF